VIAADVPRVLVTGAAGFIGARCLPDLARRGFEVHAVSSRERFGGADWHRADLLDPAEARAVVERIRPTHLLHLAWETTHGAFWSSPRNLDWLAASLHLARAFAEMGGRRAVVAGTCAEYRWGDPVCREGVTPLEPATLYGAAKHALHVALSAYLRDAGVVLVWGRVFLLHGAGEPTGRLVPSVATAMLEGRPAACTHGRQVRDLLHADDVSSAFGALVAGDVEGAVNVASGVPVTLAEVVETLGDITGRRDLIRFGALEAPAGEPSELVADARRLRDEVGWSPRHGLREGLERTVDALRPRISA
jgi:nucleoside-diphosphate-sugar epimerase